MEVCCIMKEKFLIWDLDDTLITTYPEFKKSNTLCAEIISRELFGDVLQVNDILNRQALIDISLIEKYGFLPPRYEQSWLTTSAEYFKEHGMMSNPSLQQEIKEVVQDIYIRKYENVPGSVEVIQQLKNEGYSMAILTAGDEAVQKRRIEQSGVAEFMDETYVYPYKTPSTLRAVMDRHGHNEYAMIGNSLKSDIYPALENEIMGIHVVRDTWQADHYEIDQAHPLYKPVHDLSEIPNVLAESMELSFK